MAFASLSAEVRAPILIAELKLRNAYVASLCSIDEAKLSRALRQLRELSNEESERLMSTLLRLMALQNSIAPFSIDRTDPKRTRALLEATEHWDESEVRQRVSKLFNE